MDVSIKNCIEFGKLEFVGMNMKVNDCCKYAPKSSIKAGEAVADGKYMFFTSNADESKRFSAYLYDGMRREISRKGH